MQTYQSNPNLIMPTAKYRWPRITRPAPTYSVNGCDGGDVAKWTVYGSATLSADTTNWQTWDIDPNDSDVVRRQSTKITTTGTGNSGGTLTFGSTQNWSSTNSFITVYLNQGSASTLYSNLTYLFVKTNGHSTSQYVNLPSVSTIFSWSGWRTFYIPQPDSASSITDVRIFKSDNSNGPWWSFDNITTYPTIGNYGYVTFSFDKGYKEQYYAGQMLKNLGMRGQFHVSPAFIGQEGYMTIENLRQLRADGHSISVYGCGLNPNEWSVWYNKTLADKKRILLGTQQWLRDNGLADGISEYILSVPGSGYNLDDKALFLDRYFLAITGSSYDISSRLWSPYAIDLCDGFIPYIAYSSDPTDLFTPAKAYLATASNTHEWVHLLGHLDPVNGAGTDSVHFAAMLTEAQTYISNNTMKCVTIADVLEGNI